MGLQRPQTQEGRQNEGSMNMFAFRERGKLPQLPAENVGILSNTSTSSSLSNQSRTNAMSGLSRNNLNDSSPSFDLSEFPALGDGRSGSNATPIQFIGVGFEPEPEPEPEPESEPEPEPESEPDLIAVGIPYTRKNAPRSQRGQEPPPAAAGSGSNPTSTNPILIPMTQKDAPESQKAQEPAAAGSGSNLTPTSPIWIPMTQKDAPQSPSAQEPAAEFQIRQEDFPALPVAQNFPIKTSMENGRKSPPAASANNIGPYEQASQDSRRSAEPSQTHGMQVLPDGTVTNIPRRMITDQYGMAGFLKSRRVLETDPSLCQLNIGFDYDYMNLALNPPGEHLSRTLQPSWAGGLCRQHGIGFYVPPEYLDDDLLFYLFYTQCNDALQLAAAAALYDRDWRFHKQKGVWITRIEGMPIVQTQTYLSGVFYYFDVQTWQTYMKVFHIVSDTLEGKPQLPIITAPNQFDDSSWDES